MTQKKTKKRKNYYFTNEHENAIIRYTRTNSPQEREELYIQWIQPAFDEMVDKIVFTYKFTNLPNIDYLRDECKIWLMTILDKYDPSKGSKAFSYFSIIAKNYLIIQNNANYAKMKQKADIGAIDDNRDLEGELVYSDYQESLRDFTNQFVNYYDTNLNKLFSNKRDIIVADSLLELFRIRENIENFNKKALYILVRERTGLKTQNITKVVNRMRKDYMIMFKDYQTKGRLIPIKK